jgi:hypothetical protein
LKPGYTTGTGTTLAGFADATQIFSRTVTTSPLHSVTLSLQLQPNSNDPISVMFDNLHLEGRCVGYHSWQ